MARQPRRTNRSARPPAGRIEAFWDSSSFATTYRQVLPVEHTPAQPQLSVESPGSGEQQLRRRSKLRRPHITCRPTTFPPPPPATTTLPVYHICTEIRTHSASMGILLKPACRLHSPPLLLASSRPQPLVRRWRPCSAAKASHGAHRLAACWETRCTRTSCSRCSGW